MLLIHYRRLDLFFLALQALLQKSYLDFEIFFYFIFLFFKKFFNKFFQKFILPIYNRLGFDICFYFAMLASQQDGYWT